MPVGGLLNNIRPGEWISIYGTNLAATTATWQGDFPVTLGGTSVSIDGKAALISFVSPGQINVQVPDSGTRGPVTVSVTSGAGVATSTAIMSDVAPALLLLDAKHVAGIIARADCSGAYVGGGYDILGPTGNSLGYPTVAAKAGDQVEIFAVGFGPTTPAVAAGKGFSGADPTTEAVTVTIGSTRIQPLFAGLSGAGLYQVNVTMPSGLPAGESPLTLTVAGSQTRADIVIAVR